MADDTFKGLLGLKKSATDASHLAGKLEVEKVRVA